jgi:predicted O-methyltransferase YrrM
MPELTTNTFGENKSFTKSWFRRRNMRTFQTYVHPEFAGKPVIYLELGVFEGMSMCWMMRNVLTHPDSRAVGVDPWVMVTKIVEDEMEKVHERAIHNLSEWNDKVRLIRGTSAEILRVMIGRRGYAGIARESVDISMVDGNHNALAVLDDARLVHKLLKPGGIMLFDDVVNKRTKIDHVREGVDMFVNEIGTGIEMIWKHNFMEAYRKC